MMLNVVGEYHSAWTCWRYFAVQHLLLPSDDDLIGNEDLVVVKRFEGVEEKELLGLGGAALWQDGPEHRLTLPASS